MTEQRYYYGTGRRKSAVARVRLFSGSGAIIVNGKPLDEVFNRHTHLSQILQPLRVTDNLNRFNAMVKVEGGGITGQAGAVSLGVARALVAMNEGLKPTLRQYGLLTRDPRIKERKKYGLKRARKAPQYTKR